VWNVVSMIQLFRPIAVVALTALSLNVAAAGDPVAGEQKAGVCAACHLLDGNASDPQYPKIAGQHEQYIVRQLQLYKTGERDNAIMLGFASALSDQDMADIGAFYAQQKARPGTADETVVAVGEALYRGGNPATGIPACMACHGPTGRGNPGAKYPALGGQHADYTQAQLIAFRAGAVHGKGDNANVVMAEVAKELTDAEIRALASYLEGLHVNQPVATGSAARP
jgi:cytochrome c553